ncbi:MAG: RsmD family RNA methyltransferase [Marmoricola sp.]
MTTTDSVRTATFGTLRIAYDETVLTPRDWTTDQSRWAAELAATVPAGRILELCAGAGQIGLLAVLGCDRDLVAVDLDETACRFAAANARVAGLAERVEVRNSRLESACREGETFPLMILDPPWVPAHQTGTFPEDPLVAIDGGADGLDVARACLVVAAEHLAPGGRAVLQVGTAEQVELLRADLVAGLEITEVRVTPGRGALALVERGA